MSDEIKEDVKQSEAVNETEQAQVQEQPSNEVPSTSENSVENDRQPEQPKSEKPHGEKKGQYVPLPDLIKERQRRRDLEAKIEALERKMSEKETPSKVKELMEDLDLDETTATKLAKHITPPANKLASLEDSFRKKAEDISGDYPDWFELQQEMAEELNAVYSKNPEYALSQSPETYYLKAKLRASKDSDTARQEGARDVATKINQKNLATTESAKNGTVKSGDNKPRKFTKAWLKTLSQDDFVKYHKEINAELERGGFKE